MSKEIENFTSLFDFTPNISILDLNSGFKDITNILNSLISPFDGIVTTINTDILNELKVKIKRSSYDYGIITRMMLDAIDKEILIEIITKGIRDYGYIIILEEKSKNLDDIYMLLEECDYGAISTIDIFENYSLIMGKKLHMWGMD